MKDRGEKRAENYSKGAGSMQSYSDYLNGYSQALKDSKALEMLDMLKEILYSDSDISEVYVRAQKLIKEATEL